MNRAALNRAFLSRRLCNNAIRRYNSTNATALKKPRTVFSGIQPTGTPHLGNFLGALQNWVKLQREADPQDKLIFSIVGWHSLTLPQNPASLLTARREMLAALLAIGLDPKRCIIFHQDEARARLAASRNAKDESEVDDSMLNAGLFTYPVLQAADILLYKATHVPVGEDQKQHLELARDIAETFNRTFNSLFPLPAYVATPTRRVLSLKDPSSKMSKSSPDLSSRILLTDTDAQINKKIRGAVTDSISGVTYDPVNRPGTSNLLTILAACTGEEDAAVVAQRYENKGHGELKADVAEAVIAFMSKPRSEFERLRGENAYLTEVAHEGFVKAVNVSRVTMLEVKRLVGLIEPLN
ncbi:hypothetical protein EIP86_002019 [Pleurotus ostreatoroseus]|nr:hypothetical protein EIP86_002019 [Pleurotus ostreatoroseus]